MSRTSRVFHCTPDDVFDVLTDGWSFATWVVGAARIREVDEAWPEPGSGIHHSVGLWPLLIDDTTTVEGRNRPHDLTLKVRAWPAGSGRVRISCEPQSADTLVTIEEEATSGPAVLVPKPLQDLMLKVRNDEALRRLAYLAESRARAHDDTAGNGAVAQTRPHGQ
jgi:hypothetical protein